MLNRSDTSPRMFDTQNKSWVLLRALLQVIGLTLLLHNIGCASDSSSGYASGALYSKKYRTVAVPIFKNSSPDRAIPFQLEDALVKEFESTTPYKITAEGRADTILRGTISSVDLSMLTEEMALKVTVNFEWIDMKTGKPIISRADFQSSAVFVASLPNNQPIDLARFAVAQQLARDIVASLQGEW